MSTYRVGNHQPQNVYRGEQYIGVMFTAKDAALAVEALNGGGGPRAEHPTCIETTNLVELNQGLRSYVCGPDCPRPPRTHPGEKWWWPTECTQCGESIGPWSPDVPGSPMTHIKSGGGPDWQANGDHPAIGVQL